MESPRACGFGAPETNSLFVAWRTAGPLRAHLKPHCSLRAAWQRASPAGKPPGLRARGAGSQVTTGGSAEGECVDPSLRPSPHLRARAVLRGFPHKTTVPPASGEGSDARSRARIDLPSQNL